MKRRNVMKEFRIDEISAVDHPAQAGARFVIAKRDMSKRLAMTTMSAGHAHLIVGTQGMNDMASELRAGKTSYTEGHAHDWFADDAGNIIVGDAMGHTHGIAAMVMKADDYWKRDFSAEERSRLADSGAAMPDGSYPISDQKDLANAIQAFGRAKDKAAVARHIRTRAKTLGLADMLPKEGSLADSMGKDDSVSTADDGNTTMTNKDDKAVAQTAEFEALQKRAERAEKVAELNDVQKAYLKGLTDKDQERFLALKGDLRDAEIAKSKEGDEVLFRDEDGTEYRKSDDPRLVTLARRSAAERAERIRIEKLAQERELDQLVSELSSLPGEDAERRVLLKGVLGLPETAREGMLKSLRAQNKSFAKAFQTIGTSDQPKGESSVEAGIDEIAKGIRAKEPKLTEAQAMVKAMDTPEGRKLYAKHIGLED